MTLSSFMPCHACRAIFGQGNRLSFQAIVLTQIPLEPQRNILPLRQVNMMSCKATSAFTSVRPCARPSVIRIVRCSAAEPAERNQVIKSRLNYLNTLCGSDHRDLASYGVMNIPHANSYHRGYSNVWAWNAAYFPCVLSRTR